MEKSSKKYTDFRIAVPASYDEVFSHFYFAENKSDQTITKTLIPSYQTILIFSFGTKPFLNSKKVSQVEVDKCLMLGPVKQAFDYSLPPNAEMLTVNFKDDAFYRFFGSASIAEHLPVGPDELLPENCFTVLWHELSKINDTTLRVNHILSFCDPFLLHRDKIAGQLTKVKGRALDPIKSIAAENNQTERNIQLNYKKYFGYSAKEHNRYQRFLKAVELLQKLAAGGSKIKWFEVINECGYYDQSQLIHDFKHYINLSPSKYLEFQQDICNPIT